MLFLKNQTNEPPKQKPTTKLLRDTRRMMKISRNMQNQEEVEAYTKTAVYFSGIYRQIKSQEAGETDPLKYLVRLEREK